MAQNAGSLLLSRDWLEDILQCASPHHHSEFASPSGQAKPMESPSLDEKRAFFNELDALDNLSDGDDEVDEKEQHHRNKCRAFFNSRKGAVLFPVPAPAAAQPHPRRTASMPTPVATTPGPRIIEATPGAREPAARRATRTEQLVMGTTSFVEETPVPDTARQPPATLRRSKTLPLPASSAAAAEQSPSVVSGQKKRKRVSSASRLVPEAAQIFRGLSFYYIPNNDIAPARKLRIGKAQEYGARWVRSLVDASHVVVDKNLTYNDIKGLLSTETTDPNLVVVTEGYPIDCISFRTLLNPDQNRYRIPGCSGVAEDPPSDPVPAVPSQSSDRSLQLKSVAAPRRRRPGSTPDSEQPASSHEQGIHEDETTEVISDTPPISGFQITSAGPTERDQAPPPRRRSSTMDELSEYIELMQQYKHLPLDTEEDDLQSVKDAQEALSDSDIDERSEDERARKRSAVGTRRAAQKEIRFEDRFACHRGGTKDKSANADDPNARTIEVLQSMCDYYARINDNWRTLAYRKAIATLRRQSVKITTEEEAFHLPSIGPRLAAKIEEIVCTNKLRRLEYANDEPLDQVLETFLRIYDVGISRASKWIAQGFRTLDDLRQKADLTANQRIGVERYDDLNTRIPRADITALFAYVQREAARIDPNVELLVGGSYRRGSDTSGDMDIIVTKKGTDSSGDLVPFLEELIAVLTRKGFLVATLAALHANRPGKDGPGSKWHGCCVLPQEGKDNDGGVEPQIWRRIDFLLVPESQYGAALIYFTGNDIFNRSMRLLASKKGMRLNQRGLYKEVMRGKNRVKVTEGELVEGRDEKRIFELLGVKWREPWERWC